MPNIDTTTITGFDTMTPEQKIEALLNFDIPERVDMSKYVEKTVFDRKASEAAELSRKLNGKLSDDERAQAEREREQAENAQKYTELENKYNAILKKSTIAEYAAKYLALGYEKSLAESTANAMVDGDMETVFKNAETHRTAMEQKIKSDLLKGTPHPGGALGAGGKADSDEMAQAKRIGKEKAAAYKATADVIKNYI